MLQHFIKIRLRRFGYRDIFRINMIAAHIIELRHISVIGAGYPFRTAIEESAAGNACVVQMKDVHQNGTVNWAGVAKTTLAGRKRPDWLAQGDVLFVSRGNHYYATLVDTPPSNAVCGPHLFHIRVNNKVSLLPEFLVWQLNQPPLQRLLQQSAAGSSQLSLRRVDLENLPISVPSLATQSRISKLVSCARSERAIFEQLIRNREAALAAIAASLATISPIKDPQ